MKWIRNSNILCKVQRIYDLAIELEINDREAPYAYHDSKSSVHTDWEEGLENLKYLWFKNDS